MRIRHLIMAMVVLALSGPAIAQEHPVIKPIEGFVLRPAANQKVTNFDEFRFRRKDAQGRDEFFVKKGKFWDLYYHKPAAGGSDDTSFSRIEIKDNFAAAVTEAGGTINRNYGGELQFSIPRPDGGISYARCLRATAATGCGSSTRSRSSGTSSSPPPTTCTAASRRPASWPSTASTSTPTRPI